MRPVARIKAIGATDYGALDQLIGPQNHGFSLVELLVAVAIFALLATIAIPTYASHVNKARVVRAIADTKEIAATIDMYRMDFQKLPASLADVQYGGRLDPWGNPYQYVNFEAEGGTANGRKDAAMAPLNADYDLYSKGKDGQSELQITAATAQDDILRAQNGGYFGMALRY
jgi:general secretion pathway protein G